MSIRCGVVYVNVENSKYNYIRFFNLLNINSKACSVYTYLIHWTLYSSFLGVNLPIQIATCVDGRVTRIDSHVAGDLVPYAGHDRCHGRVDMNT